MIIQSKLKTIMENDIKEAKEKLKSCSIDKEAVKTLYYAYSPYIKDLDKGTSFRKGGASWSGTIIENANYARDLELIIKKLEVALASGRVNDIDGDGTAIKNNVQMTSESNVNLDVNIDFEQVITIVNEDSSLDDKTTQEIIEKIKIIEEIAKSNDNKKSKWNSLKTIVLWITEKSVDIATKLLPLIMKALQ